MFVCIQFTNHVIKMTQEDHEGARGYGAGVAQWAPPSVSARAASLSSAVCLGCQLGSICVRVLNKFENVCYLTPGIDLENVRLEGFHS